MCGIGCVHSLRPRKRNSGGICSLKALSLLVFMLTGQFGTLLYGDYSSFYTRVLGILTGKVDASWDLTVRLVAGCELAIS